MRIIVDKVAELASKLTPVSDMAVLLDMPVSELRMLLLEDGEVRQAYQRAKAKVALEVRERELEMARAGSPTAASNLTDYLNRMDE